MIFKLKYITKIRYVIDAKIHKSLSIIQQSKAQILKKIK